MKYYINKILKGDFNDIESQVKKALSEEGFGVVTELDLQEKFKEKLSIEYKKYKILGACNPSYAHKALEFEDKIGTMLPCNIVVHELGDNKVEIAAVDPIASMQAVKNENLVNIAYEIKEKLSRVIESTEIKQHSEFYF